MLAGGTATLPGPEGARHRADRLRLDGRQPVRGHEARLGGAREARCGARRRRTSPPAAWPCGGSCSDPDQPAARTGRNSAQAQRKSAFFAGLGVAAAGRPGRSPASGTSVLQQHDLRRSRSATRSCSTEITQARSPDQGHRHAAGRDRRAEGAPEGGRRPAGRPQHAGAPAQRAGASRRPRACTSRSIKQDGQVVTVTGIAQTNERVSEFLRNTALQLRRGSSSPELIEIKAAPVPGGQRASSSACSTSRCA